VDIGVMKDKEKKFEDLENSHTLGGSGESGGYYCDLRTGKRIGV
jgi:hypothetical protein